MSSSWSLAGTLPSPFVVQLLHMSPTGEFGLSRPARTARTPFFPYCSQMYETFSNICPCSSPCPHPRNPQLTKLFKHRFCVPMRLVAHNIRATGNMLLSRSPLGQHNGRTPPPPNECPSTHVQATAVVATLLTAALPLQKVPALALPPKLSAHLPPKPPCDSRPGHCSSTCAACLLFGLLQTHFLLHHMSMLLVTI